MDTRETGLVPERDAYDSPWKQLIEDYFEHLLARLFPRVHKALDWTVAPVFLDK